MLNPNPKKRIPVASPILAPKTIEYVNEALTNIELSGTYGRFIPLFEASFAKFCEAKYATTVSNGTCALHLALAGLGIGPGDEVLVQTLTNMASAFSVSYTGAKPIPVDIDPCTWNIDPNLIERLITKNTKAILVVHIFGHPVDMDAVLAIAQKHNLYVVEDCAEAHGAKYKGRTVGAIGDIGCFSFYANKILSTGEGGMVVTNSESIYKKIVSLKSLAYGSGVNRFMHDDIGFNYRMPNTIAAIGCAQMEIVSEVIDSKRYIANFYSRHFSSLNNIQLPVELNYAFNVYWMYHVVLVGRLAGKRESIMRRLDELGIETRVSFFPMNQQKVYLNSHNFKDTDCPNANLVGSNGFYLPSGPNLSEEDLEYVADCFKLVIQEHLKS